MFKNYVNPEENKEANRQLPRLMVEGLLLGGGGLGVLALIFEIAADAFSVAAYQTLLAIHGASGYHQIAIYAFIVLSILLFFGIVPAYKAGAYLRPNAGGSGPLVEAIGPPNMRWLSWIGSSLFFLDAILTIIISSISAADVTMLVLPELAPYRIVLAELLEAFSSPAPGVFRGSNMHRFARRGLVKQENHLSASWDLCSPIDGRQSGDAEFCALLNLPSPGPEYFEFVVHRPAFGGHHNVCRGPQEGSEIGVARRDVLPPQACGEEKGGDPRQTTGPQSHGGAGARREHTLTKLTK
jgi:hypothetical protein